MLTLKESQLLHRAHLKVIETEKAWQKCLEDPRGQLNEHYPAHQAAHKARERWMSLLTRLTEKP